MVIWSKKKFNILVLGAGRGGTSLIASLLDAHPKLEIALEVHAQKHLVNSVKQGNEAELKGRLKDFIQACEKDAAQSHFPHWGNKVTTEQLGFLEQWSAPQIAKNAVYKNLLQNKKLIFITRDGRSCVQSKMRRTNCDLDTALDYWKHSVNYLQFLRSQADLQLHTLKFENLLANPEKELRAVCDFLQLAYNPIMLSGTASNRIHSDYRQDQINPEKATLDAEALAIGKLVKEELAYLGYRLNLHE
jgi:hypothetical protein